MVLVAVLAAVHVAVNLAGENWQVWVLQYFSFIPSRLSGAVTGSPAGAGAWTFITYAFLHADYVHLLSNCLWLVIFATPVARRLGAGRTLLLLATSAIAGAAAMLPLHWGAFFTLVGASGAIAGAMAAAMPLMYAPGFSRGALSLANLRPLRPIEILRDRNAIIFTAVFFGLQFWTGASQAVLGTAYLTESVIAWESHLGGFLAGLVAFYLLDRPASFQTPMV
ncbi:MAG: rhomboid family intramembrane serine protease [Hyphomicrobiales bacterium]